MSIRKNLTRKDIAKAAGVSPSTVSRALAGSELLPKSTIEHVRGIARKMGYRPNVLARKLASNKSFQLGYVMPLRVPLKGAFRVSYYSSILDAIVASSHPEGYNVTICPLDSEDKRSALKLKELTESKQVDGLILIGLKQDSDMAKSLDSPGVPCVAIGSLLKNALSVNYIPESALKDMLENLKEKSCKRLFYVHGNLDYYDAVIQKEILLQEAAKSFKSLNIKIIAGNYSRTFGYNCASEILSKRKKGDCVFFANDRMASGFYRYCYEHGVSIPGEIGVIGCDDEDFAGCLYPDLTTIRQPRYEMGEAAVKLLLGQLSGEEGLKSVLIDGTFISRSSV
jgi:LacI family transcriptional regulator